MDADLGLLIIRLTVGLLLFCHGTQKLLGWFSGDGLAATADMMRAMAYSPATPMAVIAGLSEAIGGALLATGMLTPIGAAIVIGVMINAMNAHASAGLWVQNGGYEYPLVIAIIATAVTMAGPGAFSVDAQLGFDASGPAWALVAVGTGLVASSLVFTSRRLARRSTTSQ